MTPPPQTRIGFLTEAQAGVLAAEAIRLDLQRQWLDLGARLRAAFKAEAAARERQYAEEERMRRRAS